MVVGTGGSLTVSGSGSIGATTVLGGATNDLLYQTAGGVTGFFVTINNGVLVTNGSGVPSVSATLPTGLAMQTPASINLTHATALPCAALPVLTGDVTTSSCAATVVALNGVSLAGLATGILKNTTGTGVPSIAAAGTDYAAATNGASGNLLVSNGSGGYGTAIILGTGVGTALTSAVSGTGAICLASGSSCAGGGGNALSAITAASGANTIANANNGAQVWNWAQTTNSQTAFTFGETTAATGTSDLELVVKTIAGSTAIPLSVLNSLTGAQTLAALSITPTWNTSGVVDAALFVNPTNTASGTGSLLADFQLGGTSQWKVDKAGNSTQTGSATANGFTSIGSGAGSLTLTQGTAPSLGTTAVQIVAPASVTSYQFILPGASGSGILLDTASSNVDTLSRVVLGIGVATWFTTPSGANFASAMTSNVPVSIGGTNLSSYTSGGVVCATGSTTLASSALLTANAPVVGGGSGTCPAALGITVPAQTDGATVTWALGSAWSVTSQLTFTTHGGNRTLNITNPLTTGWYTLKLIQDATGGEGLILGTGCTWQVLNNGVPATTVTLSSTALGVNVLSFYYDGTNCVANLH